MMPTGPSSSPPRPYASPDQLGGATPRSQELQRGINGDPDSATATSVGQDPGLTLNSLQFAEQTPTSVVQTSVLQPSNPVSANGMAPADFARVLPGMSRPLPSPVGSSVDTYQKSLLMRLQGREI